MDDFEIDENQLTTYKTFVQQYEELTRQISINYEEKRDIVKEKENTNPTFKFLYLLLVIGLTFWMYSSDQGGFWELIGCFVLSIFVGVYLASFIEAVLPSNYLNKFLSFGKVDKLTAREGVTNRQIHDLEERKKEIIGKISGFELPIISHYNTQLDVFFGEYLFKKRSENSAFEKHLSEFSEMIEEVENLNSKLVSRRITLDRYKEYVQKRNAGNRFLISSTARQGATSRRLVNRISEIQAIQERTSPERRYIIPRKIDWEEVNKKRKITGDIGEGLVLSIEQDYLSSIGREDLVTRVQRVSLEGDGHGYDILSFTSDGKEKYIEVKSTKGHMETPFFLSSNELNFLKNNPQESFIYRVAHVEQNESLELHVYPASEVLTSSTMAPTNFLVTMEKDNS